MKRIVSLVVIPAVAVAALVLATATAALAEALPRLPADLVFRAAEASPGKVTFSHRSHLDDKKPECTACHPALFRILKSGASAAGPRMSHATMESGRHCGGCHNDKAAFGLDKCDLCHRAE